MSNIEKQLVPFIEAWKSYNREIGNAYRKYTNLQKTPQVPSSNKFPCLDDVDKVFETTIKPILKRFFETYQLIHEGIGDPKAIMIYKTYIKEWWPDSNKGLLSPRIAYFHLLESEKDVFEVLRNMATNYTNLEEYLQETDEAKSRMLSKILLQRTINIQKISVLIPFPTKSPSLKEVVEGTDEETKKLIWTLLKELDSPSMFQRKVYEQWEHLRRTISTLIDWMKSQEKELSKAEMGEQVAETGKGNIRAETVNIVNVIGSASAKIGQIQQAGAKAELEATTGKDGYEELREVLQLLKKSVDKLGLRSQKKAKLQEQIKEIDREISSSKPNDKFVTKCLGFIKRILVEVPSHMIAIQLVERIKNLETLF